MIQIFDIDRSLSVLGDGKQIAKIFGAAPVNISEEFEIQKLNRKKEKVLKSGPDEHLFEYLSKLFIKEKITVRNEVFGIETDEVVTRMRQQAIDMGLRGIALDTISGLGEMTRNAMMRGEGMDHMSKDLWGKYGNRMSRVITALRDIPTQVFLTCHIDRMEETGTLIEYPAIKGGQKTDALKWFDVIIYNVVVEDKIMWQVKPSEERPFIRSRIPIPEWEGKKMVEPDYLPILRAYKKSPTPLKSLNCGDSGTGKTTALKTMGPYVEAIRKHNKKSAGSKKASTDATDDKPADE